VADISDVRDFLVGLATSACYPLGTSFPSVTSRQITIAAGWPEPLDVDTAMKANQSIVTVYPVPGATAKETQVFEPPQIITAPVFGMAAVVSATTPITATISGTPGTNEYLTFVVDGIHAYSSAAGPSDTNLTMAATLAALVAVDYAGTAAVSNVVTVVGAHSLIVRIGAPYTVGNLIHRQRQQIRVTVFSPTDADRTTIAKPIDVLFKQNLHLTFPDTSQGIMTYSNVIEDDKSQKSTNYRRGLVYDVCYGTLESYTAYSITSVSTQQTEIVAGNAITRVG
jgi:hypothetical protein